MSDAPDEETLRRMYWEDEMTQKEIGKKFSVSRGTVSNWMLAAGIETRTGGKESSELEHPIRLSKGTRSLLREYAGGREVTYDEALREVLPEEVEARVLNRETVYIEVSDESHHRIDELAGKGYSHNDVVAHFLQRAMEDES